MALIDDVKTICRNYADHGWAALFNQFQIDIKADNLEAELLKPLDENTILNIAQNIKGFEDLAPNIKAAIQPGDPARSLLYHAFASPGVLYKWGNAELTKFPSLQELETIENYVFASAKQTLTKLEDEARRLGNTFTILGRPSLAIVLFAQEYRRGDSSVHGNHADMCYSRTGVARVGNKPAVYNEKSRGFWPRLTTPNDNTTDYDFHAIPSHYAPYIAVLLESNAQTFGPMQRHLANTYEEVTNDKSQGRKFWVPLHKLFKGNECLFDTTISFDFQATHVNEKIKRIHTFIHKNFPGPNQDYKKELIESQKPFIFTQGIVEPIVGDLGLIVPTPHPLVEQAQDQDGKFVSFTVPSNNPQFDHVGLLESSLELRKEGNGSERSAPEYVHIRSVNNENNIKTATWNARDLNTDANLENNLPNMLGKYRAYHYVDYTADGWVTITNLTSTEKKIEKLPLFPAYSIIAAPDFYPAVNQRELLEWNNKLNNSTDPKKKYIKWYRNPEALSDDRYAPNLQLREDPYNVNSPAVFKRESEDPALRTVTAVIGLPKKRDKKANFKELPESKREVTLPDSSAGLFYPGWDITIDRTNNIPHLAAYGLGSPFPEDAKLCAALSGFWPAVGPDTAREFLQPQQATIPMSNQELQSPYWDGIEGPKFNSNNQTITYPSLFFADYVNTAHENKFSLVKTSEVDTNEYQRRVLVMGRAKDHLRKILDGINRTLISFEQVDRNNIVLRDACNQTNQPLPNDSTVIYMLIFSKTTEQNSNNHRVKRAKLSNNITFIIDQDLNMFLKTNTQWQFLPQAPAPTPMLAPEFGVRLVN